jgi:hypothetical protein
LDIARAKEQKSVSSLSLKIVFLAPFFHLPELGWFSIASDRQRNVVPDGGAAEVLYAAAAALATPSLQCGGMAASFCCCRLPWLSCAEVGCKKAQFFWLFKVRPKALRRHGVCVVAAAAALCDVATGAWFSILSRIGGNIFGFCVLSYMVFEKLVLVLSVCMYSLADHAILTNKTQIDSPTYGSERGITNRQEEKLTSFPSKSSR